MTHKCEYCNKIITSGQTIDGVKCSCDKNPDTCEMESRIVCESALCQLKFKVSWYETKLEAAQNEIAEQKNLINQFRIINIGAQQTQKLIDDGTLEITGIKSFWTRQKMTWDEIPVEVGYTLMTLMDEGAKMWAGFLNEKAVKITIRKDLIAKTEKKLKENQQIRAGIANNDGSRKSNKQLISQLTKIEKMIYDRMKTFKWTQAQAEESFTTMGMVLNPKPRNLKDMGIEI